MSISALSAGISSLKAQQQALSVEADNVANAGTENFQPRQAAFSETSPAGSGVTLSAAGRNLAGAEGPPNLSTSLATSLTNSLVYKLGFDLSAKVIESADSRIGTLIDIKA